MDIRQKDYKEKTIQILGNFQLLELSLKMYIGLSYEFISELVKEHLFFDYSAGDIENHSLERLLAIFKKLNNNKDLIRRLNKLRRERNYIAHEALLVVITSNPNMETLKKKHKDFFYLEDELTECIQLVVDELGKLKFNGHFGSVLQSLDIFD